MLEIQGYQDKYEQERLTIYNMDCMELLKQTTDKYFDLAIIDPPYRDVNAPTKDMRKNGSMKTLEGRPDENYFKQLFRVSKNQIVFGANNFHNLLPNNKGFIIYKKKTITDSFTMSMCEYAWLNESLSTIAKVFEYQPQDIERIHPTQKPVALYEWILNKYAKPNFRILDTHLGSGSHAIANHYYGSELIACELDNHYFKESIKRIIKQTRQLSFLTGGE